MIVAQEFDQLPLETKMQWVYFEGEFLMDIRYYQFKVNLYRISDFLIEVFYHHKNDRVVSIQLMDHSSNRVKFYADQVKVGHLLAEAQN